MTTSPITNQTRLGFALAWVLFLVSLSLPALEDISGWECAKVVLDILLGRVREHHPSGPYYAAFNVTNLALLVLPVLAFTPLGDRFQRAARWLVGGCFLHTLSWLLLNLDGGAIRQLSIGYYLWLLAVGILLASCLLRARQSATQDSTN